MIGVGPLESPLRSCTCTRKSRKIILPTLHVGNHPAPSCVGFAGLKYNDRDTIIIVHSVMGGDLDMQKQSIDISEGRGKREIISTSMAAKTRHVVLVLPRRKPRIRLHLSAAKYRSYPLNLHAGPPSPLETLSQANIGVASLSPSLHDGASKTAERLGTILYLAVTT